MKREPAAPWSMRRRLTAAVVGASTVFWLVSLGTMAYIAWDQTSETYDDELEDSARHAVQTVLSTRARADAFPGVSRADAGPGPLTGAGARVAALPDDDLFVARLRSAMGGKDADGNRAEGVFRERRSDIQVVAGGRLIYRSEDAPARAWIAGAGEDRGGETGKNGGHGKKRFHNVFVDGKPWRVHALRHRNPDFEVQAGQAYEDRLELLRDLAESLAWPALLLLALLGGGTWLTIRAVMRPLDATARAIAAKSADDLTPLDPGASALELRPVVDALNRVFGQLSDSLENERRFTADAAHELRTPLAALRMKTQLLQRQHPDSSALLQPLRDDVDRCTALVENLLILARLDHPGKLARAPVDLAQLIGETLAARRAAALAAGVTLEQAPHDGGDGPVIHVNRDLLAIAVGNLVDNAIRYCPAGSKARIGFVTRAGTTTISVRDSGAGVAPQLRERLQQRFFRILGSGQSGSGLGLSIVARIAALHGGALRFESGLDGAGLGALLDLPARPPTGENAAFAPAQAKTGGVIRKP